MHRYLSLNVIPFGDITNEYIEAFWPIKLNSNEPLSELEILIVIIITKEINPVAFRK